MTPILYKANETDFYHRGIGSLGELTFVEVTEEGNGDFGLVLEYPTDGRYFNSIEEFMFIKAKPNSEDEPHIFRIYEIEKDTIGMSSTIYATSKTITDLQGNMVRKVVAANETPQQILTRMKSNLIYPTTYDFYSDITTKSSTEWIRRNPLNCISGEEGSLLQYWGGEIKRGNQVISLLKRRGKDNVATIRYGKNLNGLVANFSVKGMVTRILPHFTYTPEGAKDPVTIEGSFVDSQYINNYPIPFVREVDFSNDDDVTDLASLNVKARQYFVENTDIDKPSVTMDIQIEDLFSSSEYSERFKKLEKILLFDTVTVYHKVFNINITAKVNKLVFDPYREKNVSLEVGSTRHTLMDDVKKDTQYQLNEVKKELNYVSLSADGKNRINYGSATPLIANINDLWFKPNGEFTIMYRFDGAYWQEISNSEDLDKVAKEVEKHTDEIATVTESANDAVAKADQAIADAGFIKSDVVQIKSDALAIANIAQTAYDNAISAVTKADTAISTTGNLSLVVDDLERAVTFKADSSRVDTISGKVDSQAIQIKANTDGLVFKADKSAVDTINQTVSQHTNDISINAQAINARLTETQVNNLVNGKNYVNQTQLQTTANGLQLDITKVSTDLSNLEIGGRNIFLNSKGGKVSDYPPTYQINGSKQVFADTTVPSGNFMRITNFAINGASPSFYFTPSSLTYFSENLTGKKTTISFLMRGNTSFLFNNTIQVGTNWTKVSFQSNFSTINNHFYIYDTAVQTVDISSVKVEYGDKSTDWSPSPNDMATLEKVVTIEANIDGINTLVASKASQTQVTQLATQWTQTTNLANGHTGQIANLGTDINLRVKKDELISQINLQSGNILIQTGKLYLDATSVVFSGNAFIPSAAITTLTVDKLNGGTANFANFNVINFNASNITSGTITGASSAWNLNTGIISVTNPTSGDLLQFTQGRIRFQNGAQERLLNYNAEGLQLKAGVNNTGTSKNTSLWLIGEGSGSYAYIQFVENNTASTDQRIEAEGGNIRVLTAPGGKFEVRTNGTRALNEILSSASQVTGVSGAFMRMTPGSIETERYGNRSLKLMPTGTGKVEVTDGTYWWNVKAKEFETVSSRTLKTNIKTFYGNALFIINDLNIVTYNMKQDIKNGIDELKLGLISEDSPSVASSGGLSIDMYKLNVLTAKGVQELDQKVVSIDSVLTATNSIANNAMNKTLQVDAEVQQMKNKISELDEKIKQLESVE